MAHFGDILGLEIDAEKLGDFGQGPAEEGDPLELEKFAQSECTVMDYPLTPCSPQAGGRQILRASPPAAGPPHLKLCVYGL